MIDVGRSDRGACCCGRCSYCGARRGSDGRGGTGSDVMHGRCPHCCLPCVGSHSTCVKRIAGLGVTDVGVCVVCAATAYTRWFPPNQLSCGNAGMPLVILIMVLYIHIMVDTVRGSWNEDCTFVISLIQSFKYTNLLSLNIVHVGYSSGDVCVSQVNGQVL